MSLLKGKRTIKINPNDPSLFEPYVPTSIEEPKSDYPDLDEYMKQFKSIPLLSTQPFINTQKSILETPKNVITQTIKPLNLNESFQFNQSNQFTNQNVPYFNSDQMLSLNIQQQLQELEKCFFQNQSQLNDSFIQLNNQVNTNQMNINNSTHRINGNDTNFDKKRKMSETLPNNEINFKQVPNRKYNNNNGNNKNRENNRNYENGGNFRNNGNKNHKNNDYKNFKKCGDEIIFFGPKFDLTRQYSIFSNEIESYLKDDHFDWGTFLLFLCFSLPENYSIIDFRFIKNNILSDDYEKKMFKLNPMTEMVISNSLKKDKIWTLFQDDERNPYLAFIDIKDTTITYFQNKNCYETKILESVIQSQIGKVFIMKTKDSIKIPTDISSIFLKNLYYFYIITFSKNPLNIKDTLKQAKNFYTNSK